ncbi:hypothetical protein ES702_05222 [subsurface metagenome]
MFSPADLRTTAEDLTEKILFLETKLDLTDTEEEELDGLRDRSSDFLGHYSEKIVVYNELPEYCDALVSIQVLINLTGFEY